MGESFERPDADNAVEHLPSFISIIIMRPLMMLMMSSMMMILLNRVMMIARKTDVAQGVTIIKF